MSQAGITRSDKMALLERHGWSREPRRHGAPLLWLDPLGGKTWRTEAAYEMEIARQNDTLKNS